MVQQFTSGVQQQALVFEVGTRRYAIDILRVNEVRRWQAVTRLPNASEQVLGVLNVRGTIVPVVDLRQLFSSGTAEYLDTTVIALVEVRDDQRSRTLGLVIDAVSDVLDLDPDAVRPPPDLGTEHHSDYLIGLVPQEDGLVMLIDADRLIQGPAWQTSVQIAA